MSKLKVLDLFSGIGGFSLGLERTGGFETVAFCEISPFCRKVLNKHWPGVPVHEDVRSLDGCSISADVITGGFPCQDISVAGKGAGISGERSGLWKQIARLIREIRPRFAIMENSSALLDRGFGVVCADLAEIGYDAEWECIPAAAVGAPHIRDRVWILAYPRSQHREILWPGQRQSIGIPKRNDRPETEWGEDRELCPLVPGVHPRTPADWWRSQSGVDRTAYGLPGQLDRSGACGNSVVPQIPELIGYAILNSMNSYTQKVNNE